MNECDEEIENLKQILNNYSVEFSCERMSPDQAADLPQVQVCFFHSFNNRLLSRWCLEAFLMVECIFCFSLSVEIWRIYFPFSFYKIGEYNYHNGRTFKCP